MLEDDVIRHCQQFEEDLNTTVDTFKRRQLGQLKEKLIVSSGIMKVSVNPFEYR